MQVASLVDYGATLNKFSVETPDLFLTAKNSQQIIVMLEAFTLSLTACTQISIYNPQFLCMIVLS